LLASSGLPEFQNRKRYESLRNSISLRPRHYGDKKRVLENVSKKWSQRTFFSKKFLDYFQKIFVFVDLSPPFDFGKCFWKMALRRGQKSFSKFTQFISQNSLYYKQKFKISKSV